MPEIDTQTIESRMMGFDIALCGLLETLARVQPSLGEALAEDIRAKASQLQHSSTDVAAEAGKKAISYAEIIERIVRGENPGTQNPSLSAIKGRSR
ncbi:MAG TPA: hypothetical protein VMF64_00180 [Steroidobacteraceae bacterium]|nr:hypothetical protein [Steroidobacteraceae bacterium]